MADESSPQTKVDKLENSDEEAGTEENLISAEELDKIIQESDPEFSQSLAQVIAVSPAQGQNIDPLDIDNILKEEASSFFSIKALRRKTRSFFLQIFSSVKFFFQGGYKETIPILFNRGRQSVARMMGRISEAQSTFRYLSLKKKLMMLSLVLLSVFLLMFLYRSWTVGVIPQNSHLFVNSMEEWAAHVYTFPADEAQDNFYTSSRVKQNIMALRRAVVNLKPSATSGPNPMAFFEFFVEGNSADVVVELKDREYEVIDLVQRIMEDFTFNEIDTPEGKQLLLEKIRKEVNSLLTKGKIRKLYIKQAIVKP